MKFRLLSLIASMTLVGLLFIAANSSTSYHPEVSTSFFDRLEQSSLKNITLTFDIDQFIENKKTNEYMPAQFTFAGDNWDVEVRARGRYRRMVCDFPPIKVKFSKDMLEAAGLARHNKFKLVTHCSDRFDSADNVAREQLAYELYALVNGDGFRTELVQITYKDSQTGEQTQRLGILIEDTDEMADHMTGSECDKCMNLPSDQFANNSLEMNSLFQYMIGNTDWSLRMQRNVKIVQLKAGGKYIPVPYDFDFAGMVDTEYAKPNADYGQQNIKDRIWIWEHDTAANLKPVVGRFLDKEEAIMEHIQNFEPLSKRNRREVQNYMETFFESLNDGSFYQINNLPQDA